QLSQIVRFYSLQHLAFLFGTIGVFVWVERRPPVPASVALLGASAAALALAFELQIVSLIGIGGLALFVVAALAPETARWVRAARWRVGIALAGGVAVVAAAVVAAGSGLVGSRSERATYADRWAEQNVGNYRYYSAILLDHYSPFWAALPLLALLAFIRRPRLAALCATVFGVGFVAHSLMAWKAERYFSYLVPFFFVIVGLGAVQAVAPLRRLCAEVVARAGGGHLRARAQASLAVLGVVAIAAYVAAANRSLLVTARLVTRDHSLAFPGMG